jgi:hypothetical protein
MIMEIKTLEIRDRVTFIPAIAIKPRQRNKSERYLWARVGFILMDDPSLGPNYILLARLSDLQLQFQPRVWGNRTMETIHRYLMNRWDDVENGQVLDVEFILGETDKSKESERVREELTNGR